MMWNGAVTKQWTAKNGIQWGHMEDTFSYLCIKFTQNEHLFITITHEKTAWIKIIVGVHENIIDKGGEKNLWEISVNHIAHFIYFF